VVVINFLNERNEADRRVLELLGEKFSLFNGVFGASDEVLGAIESGVDFEKRILAIYQGAERPRRSMRRFAPCKRKWTSRSAPAGRHAPDAVRALRRGCAPSPSAAA
jgi:hypothetical protein